MLGSIKKNFNIILSSQRYNWLSFLIYREQSAVWLLVFSFSSLAGFINISVIYNISNGIPGWNYYQLLALSGLSNLMINIVWYFISPGRVVWHMRNGNFDQILTKPCNPLVLTLSRYGEQSAIGGVAGAIILIAYSLSHVQLSILPFIEALLLFSIGAITFVFFVLFIAVLSYVLFKAGQYLNWFISIANHASQYPLPVYGVLGTVLLTIVIPVGFASFYSAQAIFSTINPPSAFLIFILSILLSYLLYKTSFWLLNFYSSGGG
ncbi:MAG: ABC-2 family transporter protein [Candidatus Marsarchaeota archaeon]|nr:ABC-2 family transporter protein [Candidatus Marsarchaeota archaeon]